ncbi:hypothetical protein T4B_6382 [Trichinella pseudospiralis]|uniref:Uncharacterized protein n=1 Tax=Trichinella pseudospiralis TaxID=6337 RepID=A0A0V1HIM4_TRIPS|nr:hypothetical protein T4B_6382 [Trichinella pseudospiralis]
MASSYDGRGGGRRYAPNGNRQKPIGSPADPPKLKPKSSTELQEVARSSIYMLLSTSLAARGADSVSLSAEAYPREAVTANSPLAVPPEESARIPIFFPHENLQVHLLDVGLQSDTEAAEAEDGSE